VITEVTSSTVRQETLSHPSSNCATVYQPAGSPCSSLITLAIRPDRHGSNIKDKIFSPDQARLNRTNCNRAPVDPNSTLPAVSNGTTSPLWLQFPTWVLVLVICVTVRSGYRTKRTKGVFHIYRPSMWIGLRRPLPSRAGPRSSAHGCLPRLTGQGLHPAVSCRSQRPSWPSPRPRTQCVRRPWPSCGQQ
jgi:hypothetical protein